METRTFDWSPGAQVRRVARMDARIMGIDALYAAGYVLAGFYLSAPPSVLNVHVVAAPFVVLAAVLFYLANRLCAPEVDGKTAMFHANLPRSRMLAYWTHAAFLGMLALLLEGLILAGAALGLHAARPDQVLMATPVLLVLPFSGIGLLLWLSYGQFPSRVSIPILAVMVFALGMLIAWDMQVHGQLRGGIPAAEMRNFAAASGLALLTAFLLWHGGYRWKRHQIGELS